MNQMSSGPGAGFCPLPARREDTALVPGFARCAGLVHPLTERVVIVKDVAKRPGVNHADPSRALDMPTPFTESQPNASLAVS